MFAEIYTLFLGERNFDNYRTTRTQPSNSVGKEVRVLFINAKRGNGSQ